MAVDALYLAPSLAYLRQWGIYPEDDKGKQWIPLEWLDHVEPSPLRLPAPFANSLYQRGETGLGYYIFTIIFHDGTQQTCISGSTLDFVQYPLGKGPKDVQEVIPYEGRKAPGMVKSPPCFWCLYSEDSL